MQHMKRKYSPSNSFIELEGDKMDDNCYEGSGSNNVGVILEQDRYLPIANISRIMKRTIPAEGKLSKEAKECVQECVTEFLLFITSEASEKCTLEKRKTITGEDLLDAFRTLGFDEYTSPLESFLRRYREANKIQSHPLKQEAVNGNATTNGNIPTPGANTNTYAQAAVPMTKTLQSVQMFYDPDNNQYFMPSTSDGKRTLTQVKITLV